MSDIESKLAADLAARQAARAAVEQRVADLRDSLEQRSVKGRLVDEALARAQAGADEALAVANDSRWVMAATVFALAAWFGRKPIGQAIRRLSAGPLAEPSAWRPRWLDRVIRKARS